ncbi:hypothetical protein IWX90DRAFT_424088 [Phyllosticta citrichinensis]|uniref:Uncharacterized protein n=1 Tax=Phyllosticta citrichinensis TaxID=1130410 RepID=A0ABR1Y2K2_9PEZI
MHRLPVPHVMSGRSGQRRYMTDSQSLSLAELRQGIRCPVPLRMYPSLPARPHPPTLQHPCLTPNPACSPILIHTHHYLIPSRSPPWLPNAQSLPSSQPYTTTLCLHRHKPEGVSARLQWSALPIIRSLYFQLPICACTHPIHPTNHWLDPATLPCPSSSSSQASHISSSLPSAALQTASSAATPIGRLSPNRLPPSAAQQQQQQQQQRQEFPRAPVRVPPSAFRVQLTD